MGRGGREAQKGEATCILRADSSCCTAETNTTSQSNYPPIKINFKKRTSLLKVGPVIVCCITYDTTIQLYNIVVLYHM